MGCKSTTNTIYNRPLSKYKDLSTFPYVLNIQFYSLLNSSNINLNDRKRPKNQTVENKIHEIFSSSEFYLSAFGKYFKKQNFDEELNDENKENLALRFFFNFPLTEKEFEELVIAQYMEGFFYKEDEFIFHNNFYLNIKKEKLDNSKQKENITITLQLKKDFYNNFDIKANNTSSNIQETKEIVFQVSFIITGQYMLDYLKISDSNINSINDNELSNSKLESFFEFIKHVDKFESIGCKKNYCEKALVIIQDNIKRLLIEDPLNKKDKITLNQIQNKYIRAKFVSKEVLNIVNNLFPGLVNLKRKRSLLNLLLIEIQTFMLKLNEDVNRIEEHPVAFEIFLNENVYLEFLDFHRECLFKTIKDFSNIDLKQYIKQILVMYAKGVFFDNNINTVNRNSSNDLNTEIQRNSNSTNVSIIDNLTSNIMKNKEAKLEMLVLLNNKDFIFELLQYSANIKIVDIEKVELKDIDEDYSNEVYYTCEYNHHHHILFFLLQFSQVRDILRNNEKQVRKILIQDPVISKIPLDFTIDLLMTEKITNTNAHSNNNNNVNNDISNKDLVKKLNLKELMMEAIFITINACENKISKTKQETSPININNMNDHNESNYNNNENDIDKNNISAIYTLLKGNFIMSNDNNDNHNKTNYSMLEQHFIITLILHLFIINNKFEENTVLASTLSKVNLSSIILSKIRELEEESDLKAKNFFNIFCIYILNYCYNKEKEQTVIRNINLSNIDKLGKDSDINLSLNIEQNIALLNENFVDIFIEKNIEAVFKVINYNLTSFSGNITKFIEIKMNPLIAYIINEKIDDENVEFVVSEINSNKKLVSKLSKIINKSYVEDQLIDVIISTGYENSKKIDDAVDVIPNEATSFEKSHRNGIYLMSNLVELNSFFFENQEFFDNKYKGKKEYTYLVGCMKKDEKYNELK